MDDNLAAAIGDTNRYLHCLCVETQLSKRLRSVTEANYAYDDGMLEDSGNAYVSKGAWYGIAQYLIYDINCKWSLGGRFEWFRDKSGIYGTEDYSKVGLGSNNYYALTTGVTWKPYKNLKIRPEVRYDWVSDADAFDPDRYGAPRKSDQVTFGLDLVYTFR